MFSSKDEEVTLQGIVEALKGVEQTPDVAKALAHLEHQIVLDSKEEAPAE